MYKDVNGVRPRFYNFNEWSDAELEAFTDQLEAQLKENLELDRLQEEADVKSFEDQIQNPSSASNSLTRYCVTLSQEPELDFRFLNDHQKPSQIIKNEGKLYF